MRVFRHASNQTPPKPGCPSAVRGREAAPPHRGILIVRGPSDTSSEPGCQRAPEAGRHRRSGGGDGDTLAALEAKYLTGGVATLAFDGTWRELDSKGATLETFAVPRLG